MSTDQDPDAAAVEAPLSERLQAWLSADGAKSVGGLLDHFGPQAFAVAFVLLMAPSALPIPTGGVTHVFHVVTLLLAVQLILGRAQPWLPARFRDRELKSLQSAKTQSRIVRPMQKVEKVSRPRLPRTLLSPPGRVVFGVLVVVYTLAAFIAPPFSGLDTLPSLGVVVLSLGVLLRDALIVGIGVVIEAGGIGLMIALAGAITSAFGHFF